MTEVTTTLSVEEVEDACEVLDALAEAEDAK
jgi:hypothetical protein